MAAVSSAAAPPAVGAVAGVRASDSALDSAGRCPVCGGRPARIRFSVTPRDAAYHFAVAEAEPARFAALEAHLRRLWGAKGCRVLECSDCQFCYADPFIAGDSAFYRLAYPRHGYPRDRWEFRKTAETIRRLIGPAPTSDLFLLEIGAGEGAFLRSVCPSPFRPENIVCTEYSANGLAALAALGVRCFGCDLRELQGEEYRGRFHFVCMFQVLEHLDGVDDVFAQLGWLTRAGGSAFLSVPNARMIDFYERHDCLLDMPPNHVSRWTPRAFTLLAARHGWHLAAHACSPPRFLASWQRVSLYRHLRQAQVPGTLSNRVAAIGHRRLRRLAQVGVIAGHAVRAIPLLPKLLDPGLSGSQWVHLVKHGH